MEGKINIEDIINKKMKIDEIKKELEMMNEGK